MFANLKKHFTTKRVRFYVAGFALVVLGYVAIGYLSAPRGLIKAAVVEQGYGCYQYGSSSNFGSCQIQLTQGDMAYLNTLLTTNGVTCTPSAVEINQTITCTGTLNDTRLPPSGTLYLGVQGQTPVACTFAGQVFTCAGLQVGNTTGNYPLVANIDNGTPAGVAVSISPINHVLTSADLANGVDPFTSVTCGTNNTVNVGDTVTCTATIKPGISIPSDFRFGIGTTPGGTCTVSGSTLTCTGIPVTTTTGSQTLKINIGSGAVKDYNKTITVNAAATGNLARTGGLNLMVIAGVLVVVAIIITGIILYTLHSNKNKK
jgi:hypothetical protein